MPRKKPLARHIAKLQAQVNRLKVSQATTRKQNRRWKATLARARQQEAFYRNIIPDTREGITVLDCALRYLHWNPAMEQMMGLTAAEVLGRHLLEVVPLAHENGVYARIQRALNGETVDSNHICIVHPKTGERRWRLARFSPLRSEAGTVTGVVVTTRDVTEQRKMEVRLSESEARFRSLVDNLPLSIWLTDAQNERIFFNRYWKEFTGAPEGEDQSGLEAQHGDWQEYLHPEGRAEIMEAYVHAIQSRISHQAEFRLRRYDGEYRWILDSCHPRYAPDGTFLGYIGSGLDITDRKAMQAQITEASRMESLGRLAGGIAHDFNNMLSAVVGYAELARMEVEEGSVVADYLGHILTSAEHATTLTGQLLTYARRQSVECHAVPLNELVRRLKPMFQISLSQQYKLNLTLAPSLWQVWANAGQLEQVLLNLVLNARDAMPHGGSIGVETGNVVLDADTAAAHLGLTAGDHVLLRVTDRGIGMPPEVKERIFEPFFTTKPIGQGTGLGLATCYGIVKQSGGTICVDSEPGQGATFTIYLPRHDARPGLQPEALVAAQSGEGEPSRNERASHHGTRGRAITERDDRAGG